MIIVILAIGVTALAYANGANDVSKGIATLVGSGVTNYRRAVLWGTACTVAGSLAAGLFSKVLVSTFSNGIVRSNVQLADAFPLAVLIGAIGWLVFATRYGLPVSTTHAITGALCGAAVIAYGWKNVLWASLSQKIFIPLAISPVLALGLLWILFPVMRKALVPLHQRCACAEIQQTQLASTVSLGGMAAAGAALSAPRVIVDHLENCAARSTSVAGIALDNALHWISSGLTSFARGLNDAPKIVAGGLALTLLFQRDSMFLFLLVAAAMGIGSVLSGLRVTKTLAEKITPMTAFEGLSANLITSFLVVIASRWGVPVSTTHVSSGAIIGIGLRQSPTRLQRKTVTSMLQAWLITLPASATLAGLSWWILNKVV